MKNFFSEVWSILEVFIVVYVIVVTTFVLCKNKYGYTQISKYSFININSSDVNNITGTKNNDLLIVRNSGTIKKGDIVYYYSVSNDSYIVKSGAVRDVNKSNSGVIYDIDGSSVVSERVLGKYSNTYGHVGGILTVVETRGGFLLFVLLPILIVFIYQLYDFIRAIRNSKGSSIQDSEIL